MQNVSSDIGRSVKQVRLIKQDLEVKKQEAEAKNKTLSDLKVELSNKKLALDILLLTENDFKNEEVVSLNKEIVTELF